jgi:hypothetical protein
MNGITKTVAVELSIASLVVGVALYAKSTALGKSYDRLLISQGYTPLIHPRSNFGVGTIVPLDPKANIFVAGQKECFPGLEKDIQSGQVKLLDSKDYHNLKISASGKYSPTGNSSFLSKLSAAFGFSNSAQMDVTYGETSSLDLTEVALETYLSGHKVANICIDKLRDPKNAVIFAMAKVDTMTYTFSGKKNVYASVDLDALKSTMTAAGSLTYDHNIDNSVKITTPLYVGYTAYTVTDLKLLNLESSDGIHTIQSVRVVKSPSTKLPN